MFRQRFDVVERERCVHVLDLISKCWNHGTRIAARPHYERTNSIVITKLRPKDGSHWSFAEAVVFAITAHANDLPQRILWSGEIETLAGRVLIRKEFFRECFVHNGDARLFLIFILGEIAAP